MRTVWDDDELTVTGWAYIRNIDLAANPPRRTARARLRRRRDPDPARDRALRRAARRHPRRPLALQLPARRLACPDPRRPRPGRRRPGLVLRDHDDGGRHHAAPPGSATSPRPAHRRSTRPTSPPAVSPAPSSAAASGRSRPRQPTTRRTPSRDELEWPDGAGGTRSCSAAQHPTGSWSTTSTPSAASCSPPSRSAPAPTASGGSRSTWRRCRRPRRTPRRTARSPGRCASGCTSATASGRAVLAPPVGARPRRPWSTTRRSRGA